MRNNQHIRLPFQFHNHWLQTSHQIFVALKMNKCKNKKKLKLKQPLHWDIDSGICPCLVRRIASDTSLRNPRRSDPRRFPENEVMKGNVLKCRAVEKAKDKSKNNRPHQFRPRLSSIRRELPNPAEQRQFERRGFSATTKFEDRRCLLAENRDLFSENLILKSTSKYSLNFCAYFSPFSLSGESPPSLPIRLYSLSPC